MSFIFRRLEIPGPLLIKTEVFEDKRGFFMETFKSSAFEVGGIEHHFRQDNQSGSQRGVLRGLHYQINPKAQGKLIRVVRGTIFDVAVDIRKGSPFYGRWVAQELSEENRLMLWLPPGFAHGFLTLSDYAEIIYKTTAEYSPDLERGIVWNDPVIGITWPSENPTLSEKDKRLPTIDEAENNFTYRENV